MFVLHPTLHGWSQPTTFPSHPELCRRVFEESARTKVYHTTTLSSLEGIEWPPFVNPYPLCTSPSASGDVLAFDHLQLGYLLQSPSAAFASERFGFPWDDLYFDD